MASKFGLAGGIPERRVRPIWDAVDSRQFKHALKLCVALLAKYPNSPYALALKALILERMGKPDEALGVCLDAKGLLFSHNVIPIDDLTLSTLHIVFQRLDRLDLATSCYEHACVKFPNNLEIIMGLFNCYVREYSFVKQQQTAIKMYKIVGEERFLLWAVCSIQLQVFCSSGGEKLLSLAEALLKKHITSHSLHEPEALVIYISVLEQQAKYGDALEILSGDLGSLIGIEADKLRMQGRLLARACDYVAAADIFQKVLMLCWSYIIAPPTCRFYSCNWSTCMLFCLTTTCSDNSNSRRWKTDGTELNWRQLLAGKIAFLGPQLQQLELQQTNICVLFYCTAAMTAPNIFVTTQPTSINIFLEVVGGFINTGAKFTNHSGIIQPETEMNPDDWEAFLHYLGCLLEEDMHWPSPKATDQIYSPNFVDFQAKGAQLTEEVFDERMSSALSFIQKLQMEVNTDYVRCPYLAPIEIERQRRLRGKCDDGKLLEALLNYFHRFSHLSSFTSDVEMFIRALTVNEKADILEMFEKSSESPLASPLKTLGRAITLFKVREHFGVNVTLPVVELENTAIRMVNMYRGNLPLSSDLDPQENMHGEELLSMASNVLVLLFWRTRHLGYLLEAILVLEFGLTIRKYVWQYKMLLLHLYSYLGALPLAYEWYGTLDVKNILLETVSHHIVPQMLRSPFLSETADLLMEYLKFMDDHLREAADLTFLAYRHRNYSKVIEFVQFKERLQHSNQYLMARIESSMLQLKQKAENVEEVECILENLNYGTQLLELANEEKLKSLTFNEDLQARPWWSPSSDVNYLSEPFGREGSCHRENSPKLDKQEGIMKKLIERKSLVPRLVYLSIQTASYSVKGIIDANGSTDDTSSSRELKHLLERYARNIGFSFDDAKNFILEIVKGRKSSKDFGSDVVDWVNFAIFVNAWNSRSQSSPLNGDGGCYLSSWHMVDSLVKTCITEQLMRAQPVLTSPGSNLPVLVQLVTESLSWHILVIQSCVRSMLPQGKKKKKSNAMDQSNLPQVQAIRASVKCLISAIQEVCRWLEGQINRPEDQNLDALLSHVQKSKHEEGPGRVLQILEDNISASNSELGERISGAMQSWSSAGVLRKVVRAQSSLLSKFHRTCESKLKLLETLKQSI